MYSSDHIAKLISDVSKNRLDVPIGYHMLTATQRQLIYNGVGPGDWSKNKRDALTEAFKPYESCVFVHDVCQHLAIDPQAADAILWGNLLRVWALQYGILRWLNPKAWIERFKILPILYRQLTENRDA